MRRLVHMEVVATFSNGVERLFVPDELVVPLLGVDPYRDTRLRDEGLVRAVERLFHRIESSHARHLDLVRAGVHGPADAPWVQAAVRASIAKDETLTLTKRLHDILARARHDCVEVNLLAP